MTLRAVGDRLARSTLARALVSLLLLVVVLLQVDLPEAWDRLADADGGLFALAVLANLAAFLVGALRWHGYLDAAAVAAGAARTLRAYFAGVFATTALPTVFGGDAVRGWLVAPAGSRSRAYGTVVVDRATILGCAFVVGWLAALASGFDVPRADTIALAVATGAYVAAVALLGAGSLFAPRLGQRLPARVVSTAAAALAGVRASLATRRLAVLGLVLGVAYQLLVFAGTWLVARSLDVQLSFALVAVCAPTILVLSALPVSLGGLGLREASWVTLLAPAGVGATDATLLSLLGTLAFVIASLPGALVLLRGRRTLRPGLEQT